MKTRTIVLSLLVILLAALFVGTAAADGPNVCTTIQSGELLASDGSTIATGFDTWGYNYQAHLFNGRYCDYDRVLDGPYADVKLIMKWNDP